MFPERSRGALRASVVVAALLLAACGSSSSGAGGGSAGGSGGAGGGSAGGGGGSGGGGAQDAGADAGLDAGTDAGPTDAGSDAGVADAGLDAGPMDAGIDAGMIPFEVEPNNGAAAGQLDSITYPGAKQGAVGVANDVDIFTVQLTAGQQIRWSLDPQPGSLLVPHLSVTETQNTVPILVTRGPVLEQLVLKSATYAVIVRDARNVPAASSQNQGSAQHTYVVSSAATARTPQVVAVPSTTNGTLATRYASALFKFTVASSQMVTVTVLAKGKAPASDLDTRLTLFNDTTKFWNGTNDDLSGSNTDSRLGGTLPAGDYLAVVDNLSETANDLTFQLQITSP